MKEELNNDLVAVESQDLKVNPQALIEQPQDDDAEAPAKEFQAASSQSLQEQSTEVQTEEQKILAEEASSAAMAAAAKAAHFVKLVSDSNVRVMMEKDPRMPDMIGELLEELKTQPIVYDNFVYHPMLHNLMQIRENKLFVKEMQEMTAKASTQKKPVQSEPKKASLVEQESRVVHGKYGKHRGIDTSPTLMVLIVSAVIVTLMFAVFALKEKSPKEKNFYSAFVNGSGLSTSSSDITSSETGSTDRELKNRMERFEQRLEDHKRKLEAEGQIERSTTDESSVENRESKLDQRKPAWMRKR
jgi:hypothetical protein